MNENNVTLNCEVPGPISASFHEIRQRNIPRGISNSMPFLIAEGEGALVKDVDGNVYVDFSSGIGVLNMGHSHPEIVAAVKEQAEKFFHSCFMVIMYESYIKLAEKLNELAPGEFSKKTMLINSGAEAVENAVKIARRFTKKTGIVSLECGFHGRTLLTMTLTSKVKPYKFGFGPFAPEVYKIPAPYCYRCPWKLSYPGCNLACAKYIEQKLFRLECPAENVAAIIFEPVQGEGGFIVLPPEYIQYLREVCDKYSILLIADEIQTGFCRTGKNFAVEHSGVTPDLLIVAKSLAAGIPLSGVIGRTDIMDTPDPGEVGGTYGGNPLGCQAGLKVIEIMEKEDFCGKAKLLGEKVMNRFNEMQQKYRLIGDVRGLGAMVAMELVKDRETKEPAVEETRAIIKECYQNGLIALSAGVYSNVIRLLMPLVITNDQLETGLNILENAIKKVQSERGV